MSIATAPTAKPANVDFVGPTALVEWQEGFYAITPAIRYDYSDPYECFYVQHISGNNYSAEVYKGVNIFPDPDPYSRKQTYTLAEVLAPLWWRDLTPEDRVMYRQDAFELLELALKVKQQCKLDANA